jgi:SSS family solute:Na+ symporter
MIPVFSIALILIYLVITKLIAFRAHKKSTLGIEDYYLSGRSLSGPLFWATILATIVNSLAFTAVPGLIHKGGVLFIQMWVVVVTVPFCFYFIGPKISEYAKKNGLLTQGELLSHYYQSPLIQIITASLGVLSVLPFMTVQLSAIAQVANHSTNGLISYGTAIILFSSSIGIYLFYGGSRAVVWTDALQGIVLFLILLFSAIAFTKWAGGYHTALTSITSNKPELLTFNERSGSIFVNNILSWPLAFFLWPQVFQRLFMARSGEAIKKASIATGILFAICMFLIMTIGIMAAANFISVDMNSDLLVTHMYSNHFPTGISLLALALIASGTSTLDSGLLSLSSIINRDFRMVSLKDPRTISLIILGFVTITALTPQGRGAMIPLVTYGASIAALLIWPILDFSFFKIKSGSVILFSYFFGFIGVLIGTMEINLLMGSGVLGFIGGGAGFIIGVLYNNPRVMRAR